MIAFVSIDPFTSRDALHLYYYKGDVLWHEWVGDVCEGKERSSFSSIDDALKYWKVLEIFWDER